MKYHGLILIANQGNEKRAFLEGWENMRNKHPIATSIADFTPLVGSGTSLLDAGRSFSQGHVLSGLGNVGMAALMAIPGMGVLKAVPAAGRLARAAQLAKRYSGDRNLAIAGRTAALQKAIVANAPWYSRQFIRPLSRIPAMQRWGMQGANRMSQGIGAVEHMLQPMNGWKGIAGVSGLSLAGGLMEGAGAHEDGPSVPRDIHGMTRNRNPYLADATRSSNGVPFGTGGYFSPQQRPSPYRGLMRFAPQGTDPNTIPYLIR